MYGPDAVWATISQKLYDDILESRAKRGAGEKPKMTKYDPNYLAAHPISSDEENIVLKRKVFP